MKAVWFRRIFPLVFAGICSAICPNLVYASSNPVPYLNPIQPSAVAPGGSAFTLTVTGTGFVTGSVVDWNGSPRATTFVSSSQLTAAITAADIASPTTATITVISPAPGGGTSNQQYFEVDYSLSQLSWTSFSLTGINPTTSRIIGGDFNRDGKLDWAVAMGSRTFVIPGNGDGTFGGPIASYGPSNSTITGIYSADVNGDGILDLVITGSLSTTESFIATMIGNGDGSFQTPIQTNISGEIPGTGVLADFNGDGILDFAYATATSVQTLLGAGNGTFISGPSTALSQIGLGAVATGDFNGDGKLDLVVTVYDPFTTGLDYAGVMLGNGDGSFAALVPVNSTGAAYVGAITAVVGDFNGDGKLDIATAMQTVGATLQGIIQVSNGNGDGTFQAPYTVPNVPQVTTPLLVADFNGDGYLDLSTGGFIYYGEGNGTFPTSSGRTGLPTFVLAGDAEGNGQQDIFTDAVTFSGSTVNHSYGIELQIPPTPDFKGIVAPFSSTLVPGGSISFDVTAESLYGFTGDITIGVVDIPNGITPSYNPVVIKGGSGNTVITLTAASNMPLGNYTATLTGSSGSLYHSTTVPFTVNDTVGDWSGYVVQQAVNIAPGGTANYVIVAQSVNGFAGTINLTISGLPAGATATFSPAALTLSAGGTASTTLTVTTLSTTPQPTISDLVVTGTNGILVHTTTLYLGVNSGTGDFTGTVSPSTGSVSASASGSASFTVSATPINGGAGDLALTASGMPAGVSASFAPTATIPGSSGSSTLTLTASPGAPVGTWQIYINASGSGVFHQDSVMLTITP
jgi:hypothetical protein